MRAGRTVTLRFSLGGNMGLDILAEGSPSSREISCTTGLPLSDDVPTQAASGRGLKYDARRDQYTYSWKTDRDWAGTCRQLVLTLDDGSTHTANVQFNKSKLPQGASFWLDLFSKAKPVEPISGADIYRFIAPYLSRLPGFLLIVGRGW